jgi:hypothetical protein
MVPAFSRRSGFRFSLACAVFVALFSPPSWTEAADSRFWGDIPPDKETYRILLEGRDDTTPRYGALRVNGAWKTKDEILEEKPLLIEIVYDEPWLLEPVTEKRIPKKDVYYSENDRKGRLEKGWKAAGFVFEDTPQGRRPVQKEMPWKASEAHRMAADVAAERHPKPPTEPAETLSNSERAARGPGIVQQWGRHALLVLLVVVLIGLSLKTLVLRD